MCWETFYYNYYHCFLYGIKENLKYSKTTKIGSDPWGSKTISAYLYISSLELLEQHAWQWFGPLPATSLPHTWPAQVVMAQRKGKWTYSHTAAKCQISSSNIKAIWWNLNWLVVKCLQDCEHADVMRQRAELGRQMGNVYFSVFLWNHFLITTVSTSTQVWEWTTTTREQHRCD